MLFRSLLVKTAEGIEDVIDVSTENLARLKEEAQMAENDVIMRYIRVLSELSGQIRYASQKRILVEIGLIRLCRPAMERDTGSLSDRIRQLEEKMERGVPMAYPTRGTENIPHDRSETKPAPKAELPRAIPEDVRQAVENWHVIVGQASMPMGAYLKKAYPSLAEDGSLLLVVPDGHISDYFKEAWHREELEELIAGYTGKGIAVTVQSPDSGRDPEELYPDLTKVVSQAIQMEVEELDEEPEIF